MPGLSRQVRWLVDKGLLTGCGKLLTPMSCFAGLIDDVRIYDRAVQPSSVTTA